MQWEMPKALLPACIFSHVNIAELVSPSFQDNICTYNHHHASLGDVFDVTVVMEKFYHTDHMGMCFHHNAIPNALSKQILNSVRPDNGHTQTDFLSAS